MIAERLAAARKDELHGMRRFSTASFATLETTGRCAVRVVNDQCARSCGRRDRAEAGPRRLAICFGLEMKTQIPSVNDRKLKKRRFDDGIEVV